jgi:tetratricopeptide (TPR) repeat protein
MVKSNTLIYMFIISTFLSCSSQEYTTAKLAIQQSDFKKAAEWLPKAMAVEPDNPEIPVVMAVEIYAENGQWFDFNNMFNKAMNINSEKVIEVRGAFAPVKEAVKNYTEFYWAKEFNSGVEQFKKIQDDTTNRSSYLETAILHFTNASIIKPKDANTHLTLAKCYFDKGDKKSAKKSAFNAVDTNPENFDANFGAAQILARAGLSSSDVLPYYQKAAFIQPSNSRALRELASTYYDLGQKDKSINVFEEAIVNEKDEIVKADLFFNLGVIHNQIGNFEEAEKSFDEAFYLNEDDFEAALGMARAYEGLGDNFLNGSEGFDKDLDKAARWFRKAEKKIKSVMIIDIDNKDIYKKNLDIIRFKRDIAEGIS